MISIEQVVIYLFWVLIALVVIWSVIIVIQAIGGSF